MPTAAALRLQIETALAHRIPSSLTPPPRTIRPVAPTGICTVDELLQGGLPLGAITEIVGSESSGRTSFALSFTARMTQAGKVCAWIDVSNALSPESAVAIGIDLNRLLWVRCGVTNPITAPPSSQASFSLPPKYLIAPPVTKGLHGGGCGGPHPRSEVKGLSTAVSDFLRPEAIAPRCAEPQRRVRVEKETFEPNPPRSRSANKTFSPLKPWSKPWSRIDQALRVTDLLLQAGGFSAIVLDLGSVAPEFASRIPLATWFRYRAAAERSQASILLLTQHACAKSSAGLVLRLQPAIALHEPTVFTGIEHRVEVARERFTPTNVVPMRKQPQSDRSASWHSRTTWAGQR